MRTTSGLLIAAGIALAGSKLWSFGFLCLIMGAAMYVLAWRHHCALATEDIDAQREVIQLSAIWYIIFVLAAIALIWPLLEK